MSNLPKNKRGFTLIELLVVISIIAILAAIVLVSLRSAREKANISRARADLNQLRLAMELLYDDTELQPAHCPITPCDCSTGPEVYLDTSAAGLASTDGGYPGWNGPYMNVVPRDPWGNRYIFDADYTCYTSTSGCENIPNSTMVRAIHSGGPNGSGINTYDSDNIVLVLCR